MFKKGKVGAVIVAAGKSERLGEDKMFASLGGRSVLERTLAVFEGSPLIDEFAIVLGENNIEKGRQLATEAGWKKVAAICVGGARRQDSVAAGLKELKGCRWVLVHDGARPLVTPRLIGDCLEAAAESGAAACAVPLRDTVKMVGEDGFVIGTPPREKLWAVQTPQAFASDIINGAYAQEGHDATDDAALVERSGGRVKLCSGSYENIKITTPEDLALAGLLWGKREG
jgi:2-C-methyl-D-erythritol 4-phosphate cytidylyltransferase